MMIPVTESPSPVLFNSDALGVEDGRMESSLNKDVTDPSPETEIMKLYGDG